MLANTSDIAQAENIAVRLFLFDRLRDRFHLDASALPARLLPKATETGGAGVLLD
jgi:hypothetical protein